MNMRYILFGLFVVFLFLVSCGTEKIYVCSDGTEVASASLCSATQEENLEEMPISEISSSEDEEIIITNEEIDETTEAASYILSPVEKELLEKRFTPATRAVLSTPLVKELHIGDVYVAGLAVRNILGSYGHEFVVTIKFREAKDFSGSIIPTDDDLIQAWMSKNLFTTYTLERGEELILPLIIDVGDTITDDGDPTLPGTYIYDVYIDYVTSTGSTDEYEKLLLTVQVVE